MVVYLGTEAYPRGRRGQIANLLVGVSSSKSSNLFASANIENHSRNKFGSFYLRERYVVAKMIVFFVKPPVK